MKLPTTQLLVLAAAAAGVIAVVWTVMPRADITLNADGTDVVAVDLFGTARNDVTEVSAQRRD